MPVIDSLTFRKAMGEFVTGVCVVTTSIDKDSYLGITINSFSSLSISPPLIMFAIDNNSDNFNNIINAKYFNINILASNQQDVSNIFAKPSSANWSDINYHLSTNNCPRINNANTIIECKQYNVTDGGDHKIIIGEVINLEINSDDSPLLYYQGSYRNIGDKS